MTYNNGFYDVLPVQSNYKTSLETYDQKYSSMGTLSAKDK
jgi:hypothetical protein